MAISIIRKQKDLSLHHKPVYEIRLHGRAGQGIKSAGIVLAEAALELGRHIQAFPEYGPERIGAPMKSYIKVSNGPIISNQPVIHPDVVVIIDESLVNPENAEGLTKEGLLLVNSKKTPQQISELTGFKGKIFCIDATRIALEHTGKDKTNMPMLGAAVRLTDIVTVDKLNSCIEKKFLKKLGAQATAKLINASNEAYAIIDKMIVE